EWCLSVGGQVPPGAAPGFSRDPLQQLGEGLLVPLGEDRLAVGAEAVGVRGRTHAALFAVVGDERLDLELLKVVADRVGGDVELRGELVRRERLRALQLEQDRTTT